MRQLSASSIALAAVFFCMTSTGCKNKAQIEKDTKALERKIDDIYKQMNDLTQARALVHKEIKQDQASEDEFLKQWRQLCTANGKNPSVKLVATEALAQARTELQALEAKEKDAQALIEKVASDRAQYNAKYVTPH